jgi:signal transduction histidine kinase
MRLTFRATLTAIVGIAGLALALVTIVGATSARRVEAQIEAVQKRYLPRVEYGPKLGADFERLGRSFQDAVAAHDSDLLAGSAALQTTLLQTLDLARDAIPPADEASLRVVLDDYYAAARDVSARLIADETGENLLEAIGAMQEKQRRARERLEIAMQVDRAGLAASFASIARAQDSAAKYRLWISLSCLVAAVAISVALSRSVLRSLAELGAGLQRFGEGQFDRGVRVIGNDELAALAREANRMAEGLDRLNRERRRAEIALEQSNRELEAFSYSVAHDLRAPLRAINGFSHALLDDLGDKIDEDSKGLLLRVSAAAERMGQLIDALLTMSRMSRVELQRRKVDLTQTAEDIVRQLRASSPERIVVFANQRDVVAEGDSVLLRAVLDNLLGNSWKFTGHRREAHISFGTIQPNGQTVYMVQDDGAGFDMAHTGKLFAPFQRLHQSTEFAGTGIGLATAARIVQRHGGRIWAEGKVNEGATFYFTLSSETPNDPGA